MVASMTVRQIQQVAISLGLCVVTALVFWLVAIRKIRKGPNP
jgi:hypothetical protein